MERGVGIISQGFFLKRGGGMTLDGSRRLISFSSGGHLLARAYSVVMRFGGEKTTSFPGLESSTRRDEN
jgi:hypothetical protein